MMFRAHACTRISKVIDGRTRTDAISDASVQTISAPMLQTGGRANVTVPPPKNRTSIKDLKTDNKESHYRQVSSIPSSSICDCQRLVQAQRQFQGGNKTATGNASLWRNSKQFALVLLAADDRFGRRTVEPVLSFARADAVTGLIRHALHQLWPLSASNRTLAWIDAFHFCRIGI